MPEGPDVGDLARRIAAFGLPGGGDATLRVEREAWPGLLADLDGERLTGLAMAAVEAGWLELLPQQLEELLEKQREAMMQALALERRLLVVASAFQEAGVGMVVLKGPAVAHTFYPDPSWRPFVDLDLLVRTGQWREACGVLEELGYRRKLPEPRSGFDVRFGKAATHATADGLMVDLHRTLAMGPFGLWIQPDELFERTAEFVLGGVALRRLDDSAALLHACIHASLGWNPPLLLPLRDVVQCGARKQVEWDWLARVADRWRLRVVIRHALQSASATLGVATPQEATSIMGWEPSRSERRALEAYTTDRRAHGGLALSTLRAVPGLRSKVAYLQALVAPERRFAIARNGVGDGTGNGAAYLRRWAVPLRWLTRRSGPS